MVAAGPPSAPPAATTIAPPAPMAAVPSTAASTACRASIAAIAPQGPTRSADAVIDTPETAASLVALSLPKINSATGNAALSIPCEFSSLAMLFLAR